VPDRSHRRISDAKAPPRLRPKTFTMAVSATEACLATGRERRLRYPLPRRVFATANNDVMALALHTNVHRAEASDMNESTIAKVPQGFLSQMLSMTSRRIRSGSVRYIRTAAVAIGRGWVLMCCPSWHGCKHWLGLPPYAAAI
jgi:hypothetical protein